MNRPARTVRTGAMLALLASAPSLRADIGPEGAVLYLDFARSAQGVRLVHGARHESETVEFTEALQWAEVEQSPRLDGITAMSVGGWFFPRRTGEQSFFFRGLPEAGPLGERLFPARDDWVNFGLGTDSHGFLLGTIHGNGSMPFPRVTVQEVPYGSWSQLVVVKDAHGYQAFYRNGIPVHTDRHASTAGVVRPFRDRAPGEPVRLAMPFGGRIGEAWIFARALTPDEIRDDFEAKRHRYAPALPARPVPIREMDAHFAPLWDERGEPLSRESWPAHRERIMRGIREVLGTMPGETVPLDPRTLSEEDCGGYLRRKVTIQVQPGDRMPAYLLVPKSLKGRVPAVICF